MLWDPAICLPMEGVCSPKFVLCSATRATKLSMRLLLRRRFSLGGKRVGARHTQLGNNSLAECLSSVFSPFRGR